MDITYLGHSSFKLKGKEVSLITDPFDPKMVGLKFPKNSADIITISHPHDDHNNLENITDIKRVIDKPGEYEINEVTIRGISSFHDKSEGSERGKNIIFVIDIDDISVCHLGDLGHELSEKMINDIGNVDVLMVPIGGFYTISFKEAIEVIKKIEPVYIIPMHFNQEGLNQQTFAKLEKIEPFLSELGAKIEKTAKLSVKKDSINVENQIVIQFELK